MTTTSAPTQHPHVRESARWDDRVKVQEAPAGSKGPMVFQDVTVLGLVSANRGSNGKQRTYTKEAVQAAIPLHEGARVFINHTPAWDMPSVDNLAGELSGVYWDEPTQMLRAKELRLVRTERTAHALHLCEQWHGLIGLSHDVTVACPQDDDSQVVAILEVRCVDLVAGGATTGGLYEQAGTSAAATHTTTGHTVDGVPFTFTFHAPPAGARAAASAAQDTNTMTEQETAALKAAQDRAAAAEAKATTLQEQLQTLQAGAIVTHAMEQAADLPDATRSNLRKVLEQTAGLTLASAQEIVKGRRDELTALGLVGKPAAVTGAGAGAPAPVQEQFTEVQAKDLRRQIRDQAGRAAGLKGDALTAYTDR